MFLERSSFRHDPRMHCLGYEKATQAFAFESEPTVTGLYKSTYHNQKHNRIIPIPVSATPLFVENKAVIVGSDDGYVRLFSIDLKKCFWEKRLPNDIYSSIVASSDQKGFYVCTTGGEVFHFDLFGQLKWRYSGENAIYGTAKVVASKRLIVLTTFQNKLVIIDEDSGKQIKEVDLPSLWSYELGSLESQRNPYSGPAIYDDRVILTSSGDKLNGFDLDGRQLWESNVGASVKSTAAVSAEHQICFLGTVAGDVLFYSPETGEVVQRFFSGGKIIQSGAISRSRGFIANEFGRLMAFDLKKPSLLWELQLATAMGYTSITTLPDGNICMNSARGNVMAFRSSDGRFLWESSQVLGLEEHETEMHTTPIVSSWGKMVCTSYHGYTYVFSFCERAAN